MNVIKRSGTRVSFNENKILSAITRANNSVEEQDRLSDAQIQVIVGNVVEFCKSLERAVNVEEIQDKVEEEISKINFAVAKNYITYRYDRMLARDRYAKMEQIIHDKLMATDVQNQNANVDEKSFGGRVGETTSAIMKQYALDHCMTKMSRNNHLNNEIYIHDLDSYSVGMHNCLSVPFDKLLAKGFNTRQTDVRPANSVNTAFQLVAVLFQLQSLMQFGGVSATHIDWTMVPYVRKSFLKHYIDGMKYVERKTDQLKYNKNNVADVSIDSTYWKQYPGAYEYAMDMTKKEIKQAVEACYHNLNTLQSRSGNQLPFSSINYGTCTLTEGRLITKALLEVSIEGIGKLHKTSIFPCGIFQCMKGVNRAPGDPNYDLFQLALRSTAQRLYPNYANVDWSGNAGYDRNDPKTYFSTMGCRTANGWDINGFGQLKDGRGNICPVTIILPTLAMEAGRDVEKFMALLDKKIGEAKDMLIERFDWICSQSPESAKFMYENGTMEGYVPEEGIRSALKHGTLALGLYKNWLSINFVNCRNSVWEICSQASKEEGSTTIIKTELLNNKHIIMGESNGINIYV